MVSLYIVFKVVIPHKKLIGVTFKNETFGELYVSRQLLGHDCFKLNQRNARGGPFNIIGSLRV